MGPKSTLGFSIFILGVMIVALRGRMIGLPPRIMNVTAESIVIEENAWILNTIY